MERQMIGVAGCQLFAACIHAEGARHKRFGQQLVRCTKPAWLAIFENKKVIADVESGDRDAALASYKAAVPVIDNMAGKGIVHKNKAARHKSRLNKMVKAMGA